MLHARISSYTPHTHNDHRRLRMDQSNDTKKEYKIFLTRT